MSPRMLLVAALLVLLALPASASAASSSYKEPKLTVPAATLAKAYHCNDVPAKAGRQQVHLVTGTGASGTEAYALGKPVFEGAGYRVCWMDFPNSTTADISVSAQYLAYGIRRHAKAAGKPIAVFGISQGGLLPRIALLYWPSLRKVVSDVLAAAGTQHGTTVGGSGAVQRCRTEGCTPASWQQRKGSKLLNAVNAQRIEAPGPTSWTTVRSATDETVRPTTGRNPTSALRGATNILIQDICPGRETSHIGVALDSVTYAAFLDAITHKGAARVSRLPEDVCDQPYAPGLDPVATANLLNAAGALTGARGTSEPRVKAEPEVPAWLKKRVPA